MTKQRHCYVTAVGDAIEKLADALDPQRTKPFSGDILDLLEWAAKGVLELRQQLNTFTSAVEHVTEDGNTRRSFSASEGWAMVHKDRLLDLEIAEEQLAAALLLKEAVEHELIVAGIWNTGHEIDPKKAVKEAIDWNILVARDPQLP